MVLRNELMRQQNNERLRRAFAQKANVVGQWIERHLDAVATASMQRGKLEDNLSRLYALDKEVAAFRPNMDELERYNQDIHEAMIFDNRHTPYTMEVGRVRSLSSLYRSTIHSPIHTAPLDSTKLFCRVASRRRCELDNYCERVQTAADCRRLNSHQTAQLDETVSTCTSGGMNWV